MGNKSKYPGYAALVRLGDKAMMEYLGMGEKFERKEIVTAPFPQNENILQEADRITSGARRKEYGNAKDNFAIVARFWSEVLHVKVTPMQVVLCMICLKIARQMNGHKRDSLVDIAGYARTGEMLEEDQ